MIIAYAYPSRAPEIIASLRGDRIARFLDGVLRFLK